MDSHCVSSYLHANTLKVRGQVNVMFMLFIENHILENAGIIAQSAQNSHMTQLFIFQEMQAELNKKMEDISSVTTMYQDLATDEPEDKVDSMTTNIDIVQTQLHEAEVDLQGRQVELQQALEVRDRVN